MNKVQKIALLTFSTFCIFAFIFSNIPNKGDENYPAICTISSNGGNISPKFQKTFEDAIILFLNNSYDLAIPHYIKLIEEYPSNSHINYLTGVSFLHSGRDRTASIPFLEKASAYTKIKYSTTYQETSAPVRAIYYLGKAYHLNYQFDKAIQSYEKFINYKTNSNKDKILIHESARSIKMCELAKKLQTEKNTTISITEIDLGSNNYSDYSPIISLDNNYIFFSSNRKKSTGNLKNVNGEYFADIFYSESNNGNWNSPEKMFGYFNTKNEDILNCITLSGSTIYITRNTKNSYDIYNSYQNNELKWTSPTKLSSVINSKNNDMAAFITNDSYSLYFASDRPKGYGGYDIYFSEKLSNGDWTQPVNLGPRVNSPYDDSFPFLLNDGVTLFFSSKGHNTIGGYDIFVSTFGDDGTWDEPENIGLPINTTYDDTHFVINPEETKGYYSSARNGKMGISGVFEITY